jgi:lipopolysaccharide export system protein LptA
MNPRAWLALRAGRHRLALALAFSLVAGGAVAQTTTPRGVPNALQGFQQNRGQPVRIEAASLEVRDRDKYATFSGNVKVVQGDTTLRCKSLVVFYEAQGAPGDMKAASPGPRGQQQISRLEARGGVTVTQKDQTATGDTGLFDMRANTVTLTGNVVVSQGRNVMRGSRLVVDLTSGVSRVEGGRSSGRVEMLIEQQPQQGAPGPGGPAGPRIGPRPSAPN